MVSPTTEFEDEIDLREILRVLLARWWWIAIATILSAAIAFGVSQLLPKEYQTSAYVVLTKPTVIFQFDPRITTQVETPAGQGLSDLALSDDVLKEVVDSLGIGAVDRFRDKIDVTFNGTILELTATDTDPELAASLVNTWSAKFAEYLNDLYAPTSRSQELFERQAKQALSQWEAAQQAVIDFQLTNPERALRQRLAACEQEFAAYLEVHRSLGLVLQDAAALESRMREGDDVEKPDLRDEIASLLITIRALNSTSALAPSGVSQGIEVISSPLELQIQIQGGSLIGSSVEENVLYMEGLIVSIEAQRDELEVLTEQQEEEIYALQWQLAQTEEERVRLEKERDLALEAYQSLARKAQELQLTPQDQDTVARVASLSMIPAKPVRPRVKLNTAIGGVIGLMLGLAFVLTSEWWRTGFVKPKLNKN